jgi:hypothetical protein
MGMMIFGAAWRPGCAPFSLNYPRDHDGVIDFIEQQAY